MLERTRRAAARIKRATGGGRQQPAPSTVPAALAELADSGPAPLLAEKPSPQAPLRVATVIPSFRQGSGGHNTTVRLLLGLRELGHSVSVWIEDNEGRHARESAALTRRSFAEFFDAGTLEVHADLREWQGADVALATGWQTVARTQLLAGCAARAYLVQDHEPDFYPASAEALWAQESYRQGLHCVAASPWLAGLLRSRYGASAGHLDLAVDHDLYRPSSSRRPDLVVFYARAVTPRRAVPLGLLALRELSRRRPDLDVVLYGEDRPLAADFPHRNAGVLEGRRLAELYGEAAVGMVLSLTNPSLVGLEMMACGLPCVELASEPMLASFGRDGPLVLAEADPLALCAAIEELLDDAARREQASRDGLALIGERTWERAAAQLEDGLRVALGR
ncbi:MAG TPA: glycosyltransferase family 4 protein [Solirubrobacteraceae bacterium]|jgi:glycosyltransferase involved in cell wall biosynthesis|nr:glycosyltransferase family 4 protein [Solirubrobacteraceae bacterium]